jgi:hypothetical protein
MERIFAAHKKSLAKKIFARLFSGRTSKRLLRCGLALPRR